MAGQPAIRVRDFLRRYRLGEFLALAAEDAFELNQEGALRFLDDLAGLGIVSSKMAGIDGEQRWFHVTDQGQSFANASAAAPISRKTADRVLREFMDRVARANSNAEFVYKIESVVLFGSMLGDQERLGDVDLAIELRPRESEDKQFQARCKDRCRLAEVAGRRFGSIFEWAIWPSTEIFLFLKSRSRSLSLHPLSELEEMKGVSYRILLGDPETLQNQLPGGYRLGS